MRISASNITELMDNEVFVFGSNEGGKHGGGAAKLAIKWGAKWGQAEGLYGKTYAIPTKNAAITKTLPLDRIQTYIDRFIDFASLRTDLKFLVTEIGCGLAGLTPELVAPFFKDALELENVYLPERFLKVLLSSGHATQESRSTKDK
jgi:hypothetical protein